MTSLLVFLFVLFISTCSIPLRFPPSPVPTWALGHWVWLSNDRNYQNQQTAFVQKWLDEKIPVTGFDIDSGWASQWMSFNIDSSRFADFPGFIQLLHNNGIRVVCWVSGAALNEGSDTWKFGVQNKFFLNDGQLVKYWHGDSSMIDFTNPKSIDWLESLTNRVLNLSLTAPPTNFNYPQSQRFSSPVSSPGIDGFKTDGTALFAIELGVPISPVTGLVDPLKYQKLYYQTYFDLVKKMNKNGVIMGRSVDSYDEYFFWRFQPSNTAFASWTGDLDASFEGIQTGAERIIQSGWANYLTATMDGGSYRSNHSYPLGRSKQMFTRSIQLCAFTTLLENGGGGTHTPWTFGADTTAMYKHFVEIHMSLVPHLITTTAEAYSQNKSVFVPLEPAPTKDYEITRPTDLRYFLGKGIFIDPIVLNSTLKTVKFPPTTSVWKSWFSEKSWKGPSTVNMSFSLDEYPAFYEAGTIIPLSLDDINSKILKHRHPQSIPSGLTTFLIDSPIPGNSDLLKFHPSYEAINDPGQLIRYSFSKNILKLDLSQSLKDTYVLLWNVDPVKLVQSSCGPIDYVSKTFENNVHVLSIFVSKNCQHSISIQFV